MRPTEMRINQWVNLEQAVLSLQVQGLTFQQLYDRFFGWSNPEKIV